MAKILEISGSPMMSGAGKDDWGLQTDKNLPNNIGNMLTKSRL